MKLKKINIKFTIRNLLIIVFSIIMVAVFICYILMFKNLHQNRKISTVINESYSPSLNKINELKKTVADSRMLSKNWVYIEKKDNTPDKQLLKQIHEIIYPKIKTDLKDISKKNWSLESRKKIEDLFIEIEDTLFSRQKKITKLLFSFDSYDDPMSLFEATLLLDDQNGIIAQSDSIIVHISILEEKFQQKAEAGNNEMIDSFNSFQWFMIFTFLGLLGLVIPIAILTIRNIVYPINLLKNILLLMSKGTLPEKKLEEQSNELGQISKALNLYINNLRLTSDFSKEIGKGNLNAKYKPLGDDDILGHSLLEMRQSLQEAQIAEKERQEEESKRNWVTQGIAKFSDILRQNNDNIKNFSYKIISSLVEYTQSNQAGLFLINDDNPNDLHYELIVSYAYDRRKFKQKRVEIGEGLIGACALERQTIHMDKLPDKYLEITSGLGKTSPKNLLIVPMIEDDKTLGLIEIASFNKFEKHVIEFIEQIAESIASAITTTKINNRTNELLRQSQEQSEQLSSQEEEMRQNIEEIQANQEELARREVEAQSIISALQHSAFVSEFDTNGNIISINDNLAKFFNINKIEMEGKHHSQFITDEDKDQYELFWQNLRSGKIQQRTFKMANGEILNETYSPILDDNGNIIKILNIGFKTTSKELVTQEV